ncbi:MAG: preprotein translocase subunit SecE [bacterium]|nr:preprotein translocase subunit SecE [bacterium]
MSNEIEKQPEAVSNLKKYFKGVKSEWGKITWPMRELVIADTCVVLVVVLIITLFVYAVDKSFIWLFKDILHL